MSRIVIECVEIMERLTVLVRFTVSSKIRAASRQKGWKGGKRLRYDATAEIGRSFRDEMMEARALHCVCVYIIVCS